MNVNQQGGYITETPHPHFEDESKDTPDRKRPGGPLQGRPYKWNDEWYDQFGEKLNSPPADLPDPERRRPGGPLRGRPYKWNGEWYDGYGKRLNDQQ